MRRKNSEGLVYDKIREFFPEMTHLQEGQGVIAKFANGREIHLNQQTEGAIIGFYQKQGSAVREEAAYEIRFDHSKKEAHVETIRQEDEQSLYSRLVAAKRMVPVSREGVFRAGAGDAAEELYRQILNKIPFLHDAPQGLLPIQQNRAKLATNPLEVYVLGNSRSEITIEFGGIGREGIDRMKVAIDKKNQTASVVEISGAFGRYPSYLPYPDGKEMMPHEREEYGRMLAEWLNQKTRFLAKPNKISFIQ